MGINQASDGKLQLFATPLPFTGRSDVRGGVSVHGPTLLPSHPTCVLCLLCAVPGPAVGAGGTGGACRLTVWGRGQTAVVQCAECKEEVRQLP